MTKKNNIYWENRANTRMATYHKNSDKTINRINAAYDRAIKDINADIKKIFAKFQLDNNMTQTEAIELLNSKISRKELEDIRAKMDYIQDDDLKKYLRAKLNTNAYKARITRLEALKESITINTGQVTDFQLKEVNTLFTNNIKEAYYSTIFDIQKGIGIGFSFAEIPVDRIQEILKQNWSGKNYSNRIWKNNEVLADKLQDVLLEGFKSGKSIQKMAKELDDLSSYGKFASERLIRTETTYIANQSELEGYKECDIDKYVFVATLDLRTSSVCREHDGKIYEVDKGAAGDNLPPLHPHCRSTTIAYMGDDWYKNISRRARDPKTGKTYVLPKNMNYNEWYQKFVVDKYGQDKTNVMEKMIKNKSSDKKQLAKYKEILGKESPKSLKEFQELKYNNSEEWNSLKHNYKIQNIRNRINSDDIPKNININQQKKHIKGTNEYKQKANNLKNKGQFGPSYLSIDNDKINELIKRYSSTGYIRLINDKWDNIETILNNDEIVGKAVNNITGKEVDTTVFKIHYGNKGTHIVPDYPSKKKGVKNK